MKTNRKILRRMTPVLALLLCIGVLSGCSLPISGGNETAEQTKESKVTEEMNTEQTSTATEEINDRGYVVVTDTVKNGKRRDCTKALQELIDSNPKRTIYFPDGVYLISQPLRTSANPELAVSLLLSDYAIIRADANTWRSSEAMIRLGGKDTASADMISTCSLRGGTIDGNGVASAVSIDAGQQIKVQNVTIVNSVVGLHIKWGSNGGSSDADISNVNITGNSSVDSVGMLIEGYDNTITDSRIFRVQVGVHIKSGANMLRNVHLLYYGNDESVYAEQYPTNYAFWDENGTNWYDFCYSDHFRVAFRLGENVHSMFNNCYTFWYDDDGRGKGYTATAFLCDGTFESTVTGFKAAFRSDRPCCMVEAGTSGGHGTIENLWITGTDKAVDSDSYKNYLK